MLAKLRSLFGTTAGSPSGRDATLPSVSQTEISAATQMPDQKPPKVRPGSRSYPSFFTNTKPDSSSVIPRTDRRLSSTDMMSFRSSADTRTQLRSLVATSPDLSAAMWAYLRVGIPSRYTAVAVSAVDGSIDAEATRLLQQIIMRMDVLPPYEEGYTNVSSLKSISESLAKELLTYGAMAGELVLDKSRLPYMIQPFSVTTVKFKFDGKGVRPVQKIGQDEIDLDVPTVQIMSLDQDLLDTYASSPMESAIKPVLFKEEFMQDVWKIIKRVIHPRQKVKIDEVKFRKFMSPEAQVDPEKATEEMNALVSELENKINGLSPEDALVYFDTIGFEVETASNSGLANEYTVLEDIANSRLSTGSKAMGTILGFQSGSSNIASAETMLFMKSATSAVKDKLDLFYSRMFTLALRLFGLDVVVKFKYADIDLRPEADLAAFRQTQQMMTLEQLSYGLISDEEACLLLTGKLPPPGYIPLSGTRFKDKGDSAVSVQNPSNSGSTMNQNLNPETPTQGRGQNRRAEVVPIVGGAL